MASLKKGDYVLATKYTDGDCRDHWFVGFFRSKCKRGRYDIIDNDGHLIRGNGFRKAQRISPEVGRFLVEHIEDIDHGSKGLWWWKKHAIEQTKS